MARILNNLSRFFDRLRGSRDQVQRAPMSVFCSIDVSWKAGPHDGRGEVREFRGETLRMKTDRPLLTGQVIRVEPRDGPSLEGTYLHVAVGTVLYSRKRRGGVEVGGRLLNPERFAHLGGSAWTKVEQPCRRRNSGSRGQARPKPVLRLVDSEAHLRRSSSSQKGLKEIR